MMPIVRFSYTRNNVYWYKIKMLSQVIETYFDSYQFYGNNKRI